jgi:hypothetical protein
LNERAEDRHRVDDKSTRLICWSDEMAGALVHLRRCERVDRTWEDGYGLGHDTAATQNADRSLNARHSRAQCGHVSATESSDRGYRCWERERRVSLMRSCEGLGVRNLNPCRKAVRYRTTARRVAVPWGSLMSNSRTSPIGNSTGSTAAIPDSLISTVRPGVSPADGERSRRSASKGNRGWRRISTSFAASGLRYRNLGEEYGRFCFEPESIRMFPVRVTTSCTSCVVTAMRVGMYWHSMDLPAATFPGSPLFAGPSVRRPFFLEQTAHC